MHVYKLMVASRMPISQFLGQWIHLADVTGESWACCFEGCRAVLVRKELDVYELVAVTYDSMADVSIVVVPERAHRFVADNVQEVYIQAHDEKEMSANEAARREVDR